MQPGPVADSSRPLRVALVTHSYFEEDPRLRRQAEALTAAGFRLDVIALRRPGDAEEGELDRAHVVRLPVRRHQGAGIASYLAEYSAFLVRAMVTLVRRHRHRRYDVVSIASPPDPLVFAALPLRLAGVPVILDLHEATPEFFASRFPRAANRWSRAVLRLAERISIATATVAVSVNALRQARLIGLGYDPDRLRIVANGPSLARFRPDEHPIRPFMADGVLRLVYAGAVTPLYELDVALRAVAEILARRPGLGVHLDIFGRGDSEPRLRELADELGLVDSVTLHGRIPLDSVAAALAAADIGLSPLTADSFTAISMPTKVLEYAAMGKPSVVADTAAARDQFGSDDLCWYASGSATSMATSLLQLVDDAQARDLAREGSRARALELSWDAEAPAYVELVRAVAQRRPLPPPRER